MQLKFRRVFDRDDAFLVADEAGEDVQQRRLAGAGAAADDAVQARADAVNQEVEHRAGERPQRDEILGLQPFGRETADREQRAVDGERRNDRVDARSIRQSGVDHRRAVVDAPADGADDPVDDAQQMAVVLKVRRNLFELAAAFDEDVLVGVDQDVADRRIAQQRLDRSEPEDVVEQLGEQLFAFGQADRCAFFRQNFAEQNANLAFSARPVRLGERLEVEAADQLAMNVGAQLEVLRPRRHDRSHRRTGAARSGDGVGRRRRNRRGS